MQVTPGYGATVATVVKGEAHHQRVFVHKDQRRIQVTPHITMGDYIDGQCVGTEVSFNGVGRLAGETATMKQVQVLIRGNTSAAAMDVVFYNTALSAQPVNGASLFMTDDEALKVIGVARVGISDFMTVGNHKLATIDMKNLLVQCAVGASMIYGVVVARSPLRPLAVDTISVAINIERD